MTSSGRGVTETLITLADTEATVPIPLVQLKLRPWSRFPSAPRAVAVNCTVSPTRILVVGALMVALVTGVGS